MAREVARQVLTRLKAEREQLGAGAVFVCGALIEPLEQEIERDEAAEGRLREVLDSVVYSEPVNGQTPKAWIAHVKAQARAALADGGQPLPAPPEPTRQIKTPWGVATDAADAVVRYAMNNEVAPLEVAQAARDQAEAQRDALRLCQVRVFMAEGSENEAYQKAAALLGDVPATEGGSDVADALAQLEKAPRVVYRCQDNPEHEYESEAELFEIKHLSERVAPGEPMPAGECPMCGALVRATTVDEDDEPDQTIPPDGCPLCEDPTCIGCSVVGGTD